MLVIKNKNAKPFIAELVASLSNIEVKGDSVDHLFHAKILLKQILDSIEEVSDETDETKKEKGG